MQKPNRTLLSPTILDGEKEFVRIEWRYQEKKYFKINQDVL